MFAQLRLIFYGVYLLIRIRYPDGETTDKLCAHVYLKFDSYKMIA